MRILLGTGLAFAACALVQCKPREFNQSETKSTGDIASMKADASGNFTVSCKNGTTEYNVTPSQIQNNQVCMPASGGVVKVNPLAFNAYEIWSTGKGSDILDYPADNYKLHDGERERGFGIDSDRVFYLIRKTLYRDINWPNGPTEYLPVPTKDAKVANDTLEYPILNGKQLTLKFSAASPNIMNQWDAMKYCQEKGMRLPTWHEILDFCTIGVSEPNYGPQFKAKSYPKTARCFGQGFWTATSETGLYQGWYFDGYGNGQIFLKPRKEEQANVRCVGR